MRIDTELKKYAVLIPAYQPNLGLIDLVRELLEKEIEVLVVNDGSVECDFIFDKIKAFGVKILHHDSNCGKGRAIKTGLAWLYESGYSGVVTADADGQHTIKDISKILEALKENKDCLILGARTIDSMPGRSKVGNSITQKLFHIMYGIRLQDTQTGLRGIHFNENFEMLMNCVGEGYEYEMNMLVHSNNMFNNIIEIEIDTVYIDDNESSHFRPIVDGMKIYSVLFRNLPLFLVTSMLSFVLDFTLCMAIISMFNISAAVSTVIARGGSSIFNFMVNKHYVFNKSDKANSGYTLRRYIVLAISFLIVNAVTMFILVDCLSFPASTTKLCIEIILYMFSFSIQNKYAFKSA